MVHALLSASRACTAFDATQTLTPVAEWWPSKEDEYYMAGYIIRCSIANCYWGYNIATIAEMQKCYEAFWLHCVETHSLRSDDKESFIHFEVTTLQLKMLKK